LYKEHLENYAFLHEPITTYSAEQVVEIEQKVKSGLWADTEYTVHCTFEDAYTNDSSIYYATPASVGLKTLELPPDRFTSVQITGNTKPSGSALEDICTSYAKAVGLKRKQVECDENNVVPARRGRMLAQAWKVVIKVKADPSGENTQEPDYIVEEKSSENCPSCVDSFVQALSTTDSANSF
jgi:hypothetical protein